LEEEIAEAKTAGFDLDSLTVSDFDLDGRPVPLYSLGDLRDVLDKHSLLIPDTEVDVSSSSELQIVAPGSPRLRITVSPEYYDAHTEDVELWSPGSPAFPAPTNLADGDEVKEVDIRSLLFSS
jgi:hypothetical protein